MVRSTLAVALVFAATAAYAQAPGAPTFTKDVAPILYKNCTNCHRPGEIGPMPLRTYAEARPYARAIATKVADGSMPPWHADPAYGQYLNDRSLTAAEKNTLARWASSGAPEGDAGDLPPQPTFEDGWMVGKPDLVLSMQEDYKIPASGTLEYKFFDVPTNFTEDRYVQALEVRPGNRAVVHHIIITMRSPEQPKRITAFMFAPGMNRQPTPEEIRNKRELNDRPPSRQQGGAAWLGGFAPGQGVRIYQPGTALRVPAGAILTFQMHYTTNGTEGTDRSSVGLVFAKEKPQKDVIVLPLQNENFVLKAGAPDTRVDAELIIREDVTLWSALPHTHLRGKRWEVTEVDPDGTTKTILSVPKYDFNWQSTYELKTPVILPPGTTVRYEMVYDNSVQNPANPDPNRVVPWGQQTWDEMLYGVIRFRYLTQDALPQTITAQTQPAN